MDPFSALGLAGNIVQFVDFSCKLFSQTREIYSSATGAAGHVEDANSIARSLHDLSLRLVPTASRDPLQRPRDFDPSMDELSKLAAGCRETSSELMGLVERLRSRGSRWSSFVSALMTVAKEDQVMRLRGQLEEYRNKIALCLEVMQIKKQSAILWRVDALQDANANLQAYLTDHIRSMREEVLSALEQLRDELLRQHFRTIIDRQTRASRRDDDNDDDVFFRNMARQKPIEVSPLVATLQQTVKVGQAMVASLALLRTLRFNLMSFRHSKIKEAHMDTCRWMFEREFSRWLVSPYSLFWISGKPGSGKSTLMKFLVDNRDVSQLLTHWARETRVLISSYFFWINGTDMQKSQEGLLRSLLYDLLRQDPNLTYIAFPERHQMLWSGYGLEDLGPWTREDLFGAFRRLVGSHEAPRVCLFVDGLDEYSGDHEELIQVLRELSRSPSVKLCISSRPWNVFETAFGAQSEFKIYLEDFNRPDIDLYVKNMLFDRQDFQALRMRDPAADQLLMEVTARAQGVFLWVFLVVKSLINGLQNSDRIVDMQRRLRAIPSDLDEFFDHILKSIDETYRTQSARAFLVTLSAPRPLSLLNYWYLDLEEHDPDFLSRMPVRALNGPELEARQDQMRRRLNGRCMGLLEVTHDERYGPPYGCRVDFLHRTVKDFLRRKGARQMFSEWARFDVLRVNSGLDQFSRRPSASASASTPSAEFDPHYAMAVTGLAELKSAPIEYGFLREPGRGPVLEIINDVFFAAQQHEKAKAQPLSQLLDDLDRTVSQHAADHPTQQPHYPWGNWGSDEFMAHAVKWNVQLYIQYRLETETRDPRGLRARLLAYADQGHFAWNGEKLLGPDTQMIEKLTRCSLGQRESRNPVKRWFSRRRKDEL